MIIMNMNIANDVEAPNGEQKRKVVIKCNVRRQETHSFQPDFFR